MLLVLVTRYTRDRYPISIWKEKNEIYVQINHTQSTLKWKKKAASIFFRETMSN